jgi:hypothetical protein
MAITSVNDLLSAYRQRIRFLKTGTRTSVTAGLAYATRDLIGYPRSNPPTNGAGSLVMTNISGMTAAGLKPQGDSTNAPIWGVPEIFSNTGRYHLGHLEANALGVAGGSLMVVDMIWAHGTITTNTTVNVSSTGTTDISARVPKKADGTTVDYSGVQLAVEVVAALGASATITATYTDQDNNTGHTTGAVSAVASAGAGRIVFIPLATGDKGIKQIETITTANISTGQLNVILYRDLAISMLANSGDADNKDAFALGFEELFATSALAVWEVAGATTMGGFRLGTQVASK